MPGRHLRTLGRAGARTGRHARHAGHSPGCLPHNIKVSKFPAIIFGYCSGRAGGRADGRGGHVSPEHLNERRNVSKGYWDGGAMPANGLAGARAGERATYYYRGFERSHEGQVEGLRPAL